MQLPKYLQTPISEEPRETYRARMKKQYRDALIEHPEDEVVLIKGLMIYLSVDEENNDEAESLAQKLLTLTNDKEAVADAYVILARICKRKNDAPKAIEYYNKVIEADNTEDETIMELAQIYFERRDLANAIKTYKLLDNPLIPYGEEDMNRNCAAAYFNNREFDKAFDCYLKVAEKYPAEESILLDLGETCLHLGKLDEAMLWFKKVLELKPDSAKAYFFTGLCFQKKDDFYMSMHNYMEALKLKPDYANAFNNIAKLYLEHEGDISKAIGMLEKAVETSDETSRGNFYLGLVRVYRQIADYEKVDYYKVKFIESMGFDAQINDEGDAEGE